MANLYATADKRWDLTFYNPSIVGQKITVTEIYAPNFIEAVDVVRNDLPQIADWFVANVVCTTKWEKKS